MFTVHSTLLVLAELLLIQLVELVHLPLPKLREVALVVLIKTGHDLGKYHVTN